MNDQYGGTSALREPVAVITDHGGIYRMTLPEGFEIVQLPADEEHNNYIESYLAGSSLKLCYEQINTPLMPEDQAEMENLFAEKLSKDSSCRRLNLMGEGQPDDSAIYGALCQCFVFGGRLVRDGSCIDENKTVYELRRIGPGDNDRNVLYASIYFQNFDGTASKRQAVLVMAAPPSEGGCGYVWLEGTASEISDYEEDFMTSIREGVFKQLVPCG